MRVVNGSEIEYIERANKPRGGRFRQRKLLEGKPGTPSNYLLQQAETFGDFASPRHKHNFDQYRFQLRGTFEFSRDGTMTPGVVGYFPEGTPYGPQTSAEDSIALVLQFGGASGNGYMSEAELTASVAKLKEKGEFNNGVYTIHRPDGSKVNQDAYEACWEHNAGRELEYPAPRFQAPVFMNPEGFAWVPSPSEAGVATKTLGSFGERRTDIGFARIEAGSAMTATGARLFFVLSGEGTLDNHAWQPESAIELETGETGAFHARTDSKLLFIGLPALA
jgi:quercetin dioxygenase-like cupin family protein